MQTRRQALQLISVFPLMSKSARAEIAQEFPIQADDGAPVQNFRIPSELDPAILPGIVWNGMKSADVIFYEFFDYNCAFCRKAAREIEAIRAKDSDLRFGLINNAILSIGSIQAAKVQQAILKLRGPQVAYDFHVRMFATHGQSNGASALSIARDLGLDVRKVEETADSAVVTDVLSRQTQLSANLGMSMTPSFVIAGIGILGWPGVKALQSIIANARKCDHPVCDEKN